MMIDLDPNEMNHQNKKTLNNQNKDMMTISDNRKYLSDSGLLPNVFYNY